MASEAKADDAWRAMLLTGSGRSGSTLLNRLLGQYADATTVGEAVRLWECAFERGELCGCGQPLAACPFWHPVLERMDVSDPEAAERVVGLRGAALRWTQVLRTWLRRPSRAAADYADLVRRLFATAADEADAPIVVDSSKQPIYTAFLLAALGRRVCLVHLVRDPRAVAYSLQRRVRRPDVVDREEYMPTYSAARSAFAWLRRNLQAEVVAALSPRCVRIRYEDLLADPRGVLSRLRSELDLPTVAADFVGDGTAVLDPCHGVAGNPRRFEKGSVALAPDDEWRTRMTPSDRRKVELLTWPLRWRYGY